MKCVKAVAVDGMAADVKTCMEVSRCLLKPFKDIDTDCGVFVMFLKKQLLLLAYVCNLDRSMGFPPAKKLNLLSK